MDCELTLDERWNKDIDLMLIFFLLMLLVIPQHQFGFVHNHCTTEKIHRVVDYISKTSQTKKILFRSCL